MDIREGGNVKFYSFCGCGEVSIFSTSTLLTSERPPRTLHLFQHQLSTPPTNIIIKYRIASQLVKL